MRTELGRFHTFDRTFTAEEFKAIVDGSLGAYLAQNSGLSVTKNLNIELEGQQAYISGDISARAYGATIDIKIEDYSLNQREPGRIGVIDLNYRLKYSGNLLTDLKVSEESLKRDFESALIDQNTFMYRCFESQFPQGSKGSKFALTLKDSRFAVHIETV
jgi:hypothetical protein